MKQKRVRYTLTSTMDMIIPESLNSNTTEIIEDFNKLITNDPTEFLKNDPTFQISYVIIEDDGKGNVGEITKVIEKSPMINYDHKN